MLNDSIILKKDILWKLGEIFFHVKVIISKIVKPEMNDKKMTAVLYVTPVYQFQ